MASDNALEICTLTLKRTDHIEGGLVQAHITGDNGTIKLDGIRRQDETCQFYCHQLTDTSSGTPQSVVRFESVAHGQFNLHWDNKSARVCLQDSNGTNVNPKHNVNVWWIQAGPKTSALLKPYQYPDGSNYNLAFVDDENTDYSCNPVTNESLSDATPNLTPCLRCARQNGLLDIEPYNKRSQKDTAN